MLHTNDAHINGTITAIDGMIGGFTIEPTQTEEGTTKPGGWLYSGEIQEGQDSIQIGDDKSIFLSATDMSGTITFTEYTEDDEGNLVVVESQSFERDDWRVTVGNNFGVTRDGSLFANDAILNDCTITGGTFKIGNDEDGYHTWISEDGVLSAQGAHIEGTITAAGDMGKQYPSLVSIDETSPICFKAGGIDDVVVIKEETLAFTSDGSLWSETRSFDDEQLLIKAQCLTSNKVHEGSGTSQISITNVMAGNGYYYGSTTVELLPNWVSEEHIVELSVDSSEMQVSYVGDGKVKVDVRTFSVSPADTYVGFVTYHYKFVENLNVSTEIVADKNEVTFSFEPQINGAKYEIDVQYELEPKKLGFKVLRDGSLYASAANITGTINATDGEFNGTVYAVEGEIGGCSIVNGVLKIKNANISEKLIAENINGTYLDIAYGTFENCTIKDTCELTGDNSTTSITNHGLKIYSTEMGDIEYHMGAGGSFMYTGASSANIPYPLVFGVSTVGVGTGTTYMNTTGLYVGTNGLVALHSNSDSGISLTSDNGDIVLGAKTNIGLSTEGTGTLDGTWKLSSGEAITSDKNLKHDITSLDDNYSSLFDALKPMKFKYNDGTSNRYHTGFIAQDVYEATVNAGLTTNDFAAYVEFTNEDDSMQCGLRYSEFVSLNTWQIQKLKKRVEELEIKLAALNK